MIWIGLLFAALFAGLALWFRQIMQQSCPHCGHRKFEHESFNDAGAVFGPYPCKRCGKKCEW